jgi:hypothetical protein
MDRQATEDGPSETTAETERKREAVKQLHAALAETYEEAVKELQELDATLALICETRTEARQLVKGLELNLHTHRFPPGESAEAGYYILPHVVLWPGRTYPEEKAAQAKVDGMNAHLGDREVRVGNYAVGETLGFAVRPHPRLAGGKSVAEGGHRGHLGGHLQ